MEFLEATSWWDVEQQQLFPDALLPESHTGSSNSPNELLGLPGVDHVEQKNGGTDGSSFAANILDKVDLDSDFASWMDEKMDLTILDDLESYPNHLDDPLVMDGDTAALLASWMEDEPDLWNSELPITETKNTAPVVKEGYDTPPYSPESIVPDLGNVQPEQTPVKSPLPVSLHLAPFSTLSPVSSPNKPFEYPEVSFEVKKNIGNSMSAVSSPGAESGSEIVFVEDPQGSLSMQVALSPSSPNPEVISVSHSENSKRYKPYGLSPYSEQNSSLLKPQPLKVVSGYKATLDDSKKQRKRVQNKDAATRYRVKKKAECDALLEDEAGLLNQNQNLKDKVKQLSSEITYLKGLMREICRARGLLK